jgi:hypothetical protein
MGVEYPYTINKFQIILAISANILGLLEQVESLRKYGAFVGIFSESPKYRERFICILIMHTG